MVSALDWNGHHIDCFVATAWHQSCSKDPSHGFKHGGHTIERSCRNLLYRLEKSSKAPAKAWQIWWCYGISGFSVGADRNFPLSLMFTGCLSETQLMRPNRFCARGHAETQHRSSCSTSEILQEVGNHFNIGEHTTFFPGRLALLNCASTQLGSRTAFCKKISQLLAALQRKLQLLRTQSAWAFHWGALQALRSRTELWSFEPQEWFFGQTKNWRPVSQPLPVKHPRHRPRVEDLSLRTALVRRNHVLDVNECIFPCKSMQFQDSKAKAVQVSSQAVATLSEHFLLY